MFFISNDDLSINMALVEQVEVVKDQHGYAVWVFYISGRITIPIENVTLNQAQDVKAQIMGKITNNTNMKE